MHIFARKLTVFGLIALASLILTACNKQEETSTSKQAATQTAAMNSMPAVISFKKMALYPEGLEYDAKTRHFLVTSLHEGTSPFSKRARGLAQW